jgi:hypothetical protein
MTYSKLFRCCDEWAQAYWMGEYFMDELARAVGEQALVDKLLHRAVSAANALCLSPEALDSQLQIALDINK